MLSRGELPQSKVQGEARIEGAKPENCELSQNRGRDPRKTEKGPWSAHFDEIFDQTCNSSQDKLNFCED